MINSNENKDKIDVLKDILYSKNEDKLLNRKRHVLKDKGDFYDTPTTWEEEKESNIKIPYGKILLGAFVFFILAFGFAFLKFFIGSNTVSGDNIEILVSGPVSVSGGEEFSLDIEVKNKNNVDLNVVDLHVEYPEGTRSADGLSTELKRYSEVIGDIEVGQTKNKNVKAILFGEENTQKIINISVEYRIPGSNAIFNKQKNYTILISSSPINIRVDSLGEVNSNQQVDFNIEIESNSLSIINNSMLKIEYPFGFKVVSTSPSSASSNNSVFNLGDLEAGAKRTIKISGVFQGQDGEDKTMKFFVGTPKVGDDNEIGTIFTYNTKIISIKKSFVTLSFLINNSENEEVAVGTNLPVKSNISWRNNLTERIYNMVVDIKINGIPLDKTSIRIDAQKGFYNSYDNRIVFDKNSNQSFNIVEPGSDGVLSFDFYTLDQSSKPGITFGNSEIDIEILVSGNRVGNSEPSDEVMFSGKKTIKISSGLRLLSKGYRTVGPFQNIGPFPPKVDVESTYTITWTATNSFNNIRGAKVSAFLPSNINWYGYTSPDTEKIYFDQNTREVVWNIGDMKMNTGDKNPARSVSFQVSAIPSVSQLDKVFDLLGEATIKGTDYFSGATIGEVRPIITTDIVSDPLYVKSIGIVTQ